MSAIAVPLPEDAEPIGDNHWITYVAPNLDAHPEAWDPCGIIEWHLSLIDGELCGGYVPWWLSPYDIEHGRPCWQLVAFPPLELSPSILCAPDKGGCGMHGFIRAGAWVSA